MPVINIVKNTVTCLDWPLLFFRFVTKNIRPIKLYAYFKHGVIIGVAIDSDAFVSRYFYD